MLQFLFCIFHNNIIRTNQALAEFFVFLGPVGLTLLNIYIAPERTRD